MIAAEGASNLKNTRRCVAGLTLTLVCVAAADLPVVTH